MVGGGIEIAAGLGVAGVGVATSEVGVGVPLVLFGGAGALRGADHFGTGFVKLTTGQPRDTLLNQGFQALGASPQLAGRMETSTDLALALGSGLGAVLASPRLMVLSNGVNAAETAGARGGTYVLRNSDEAVVRTGRTNDLARRQAEHARDPALEQYRFEEVHRTDVYAEQRGLEAELYKQHPNLELNKIRPISPRNPNILEYEQAAQDYLLRNGSR